MTEKLADYPPAKFIDHLLRKLPAPKGPDRLNLETGEVIVGEKLWPQGWRLHGTDETGQRAAVIQPWRFKQCGGGIRGGKSVTGGLVPCLDYMWRFGERRVPDDLWGIIGDTYDMAQEEMRHADRILTGWGIEHTLADPEGRPWSIKFPNNACEIRTLTASDVSKIASRPYRGIVVAEAAQTVEQVLTNAQERVSETRGWVLMEGTFEATKGPWYALKALEWSKPGAEGVYYSLPSWDNLIVYPGGRTDPEILAREANMSPELFYERFGGLPSKRSDLVMRYANDRFHIKRRFPHLGTSFDDELPVFLFSDPGTAHAFATFAVQPEKNTLWVIDTIYRWGRTVEEIVLEAAAKPWARNVTMAIMDFAAKQRRAEGPPVVQQWAQGWWKHLHQQLAITAQPVPLVIGYDWHRRALLNGWPEEDAQKAFNQDKKIRVMTDPDGPRIYFDPAAAAPMFGGVVDGRMYAGEYNLHKQRKNREQTILADDPIDTDNDGIKALNYGGYWYWASGGAAWEWYRAGATSSFSVEVA